MTTPGGMQWLNVMDPHFNLHLREDLLANVWLVKKPADGVVTSVEAVQHARRADGHVLPGARKPGIPERQEWRDLVATLPRLESVAARARSHPWRSRPLCRPETSGCQALLQGAWLYRSRSGGVDYFHHGPARFSCKTIL